MGTTKISAVSVIFFVVAVLMHKGALSAPIEPSNESVLFEQFEDSESESGEYSEHHRITRKAPSVPTAPLDPNETIHHTLDELNQILGSVGGAGSGLVMGLTGISITDCGLSVKDEDLSTISCAAFLDKISQCDSLSHIKPLLQQAKEKYKKKPNSRAPCFSKRGGRKGQKKRN
ncbi:unnamed protein product [Orchesella dallaii]|uniref:Uncharacterized protein n=1 Tax=Orchesella dallaii TaxID=48710 RepID=A0ABP1R486_9HEXA